MSRLLAQAEMTAQRPDWLAGVVGLELRNPLGSKSARFAGGISADLAEMAQLRRFAFELRRCQRAAAARISPACEGNSMTAGLFNVPGWWDSNFGSRKENDPSAGVILRSTCRLNGACMVARA